MLLGLDKLACTCFMPFTSFWCVLCHSDSGSVFEICALVCRTQDEFQAEPLKASPTRQLLQLEEVCADLFEHALHHGMRIRGRGFRVRQWGLWMDDIEALRPIFACRRTWQTTFKP